MPSNPNAFRSVPLSGAGFVVLSLRGEEAVSKPFRFEIELRADRADLDLRAPIGATACLTLSGADGERTLFGTVSKFEQGDRDDQGRFGYRAVLVPRVALSALGRESRIFQGLNAVEIVQAVLTDGRGSLEPSDIEIRLAGSYPKRDYVVQYQESALQFAERLLEDEGISYFFDHSRGRDVLVLTDSNAQFPNAGRAAYDPAGLESTGARLESLRCTTQAGPQQVLLGSQDAHEIDAPHHAMATVDALGFGRIVEQGAMASSPERGAALAEVRAEEHRCRQQRLHATTGSARFGAGSTFAIEGSYRDDFNRAVLVTRIGHRARDCRDYRAEIDAVFADVPFRPARRTPVPKLSGVVTARVDAASAGESTASDADGRYRVRMPFDLGGAPEGQRSQPVPMVQPYGGRDRGMHFPLPPGAEVLVACVDGDPNRPVIAGALPERDSPATLRHKSSASGVITTPSGATFEVHDPKTLLVPTTWQSSESAPSRAGALLEQPQLTVDEDQNTRLTGLETSDTTQANQIAAIEAENTAQGGQISALQAEDTAIDNRLDAVEADQAAEDAVQDIAADATWMRLSVPYATDKRSYIRLGATPPSGDQLESEFEDSLALNTAEDDRIGIMEFTSGNRTEATLGNREIFVGGKQRMTITEGGLGLYDAEPIYYNDFSQEAIGTGWRQTEATRVSSTSFSFGETESFSFGLNGSYFVGFDVSAALAVSLSMSAGISYELSKDFAYSDSKKQEIKAREQISLSVQAADPFWGKKELVIAGILGGVAGTGAAITAALASGRDGGARAAAAAGSGITVGLAAAAGTAAIIDVAKQIARKKSQKKLEDDAFVLINNALVDMTAAKTNSVYVTPTAAVVTAGYDAVSDQPMPPSVSLTKTDKGVEVEAAKVTITSTGTVEITGTAITIKGPVTFNDAVTMLKPLKAPNVADSG